MAVDRAIFELTPGSPLFVERLSSIAQKHHKHTSQLVKPRPARRATLAFLERATRTIAKIKLDEALDTLAPARISERCRTICFR